MTDEERRAKVEELERAIRGVFDSEGFRRWSEVRRSFHDYSWANQFMIAAQAPNASRVAGYKAWKALGRQVKKGEHGIRIWAPRTRKNDETGERELVGFMLVPVFDVAQTEGDELPSLGIKTLETADYPAALERLEHYAREDLGHELEYAESLGGANGHVELTGRKIAVLASLSVDARLKTLAHECAHVLEGTGYELGRDRAEVVVETAAALALQTLGLDTSGYSVPYIATYAESSGLEVLKKDLGVIHKIASALETAILPAAAGATE